MYPSIGIDLSISVLLLTWPPQGLDEGPKDDSSAGAKRKWYEEQQKRKEEVLARLGLDPSQSHRCVWEGFMWLPLTETDCNCFTCMIHCARWLEVSN